MKDPIRVTTATSIWKKFRRMISRNEWAIWLLGLSRTRAKPTESGLIMIQIDGLSRQQIERAIQQRRMPFLNSLIECEQYGMHTFYSGLPSSTPAVQGELFYGKRTVVPAFGFRDHRTGRLVRMFADEIANDVEQRMRGKNPGLLEQGSSYCNIYGGGADEVHFCATSFGWGEFLSTINPLKILLVLLLNFWMFVRVAGLMIVELFLATFDFVRGIWSGRRFWQELMMIPARVAVVVLLRELVTIGACFDAARGQPIIHLNLLGYDEQAHRRGPGSRFAHWTLRGIDNAVCRIWNAAHRGAGREYDVWVYSDHGQEKTKPYQLAQGKLIQEVVAEIVNELCSDEPVAQCKNTKTRLPTRANWLGIGWIVSKLFGEQDQDMQSRSEFVHTVTSGPLGFVYLLSENARECADHIASRLAREFHVPLTALRKGHHQAIVHTNEGSFLLPRDAVQVFGADHPFLQDITEDFIRLAHHTDSGEIMLVGWNRETDSTSFVLQNGAHAGPGIQETSGFALLPPDSPTPRSNKRYLRPDDLRLAAMSFMGRSGTQKRESHIHQQPEKTFRLLTYNVHGCVGMDGQLSPERIARVIAQSGANIVCLQELDVLRHRSGNQDQAHAIAKYLQMHFEFHPAWHLEEEQFGNAILSSLPMRIVQAQGLHHHRADRSRRSALWVEIEVNSTTSLQVINTHMSIYPTEQLIQAKELCEAWVQPASLLGPVVVCGDFNARPKSKTHNAFARDLHDVESIDHHRPRPTYFSPFPITRVDHIFTTSELSPQHVSVMESRIARVASDHLPLIADLKLQPKSGPSPSSNLVNKTSDTGIQT